MNKVWIKRMVALVVFIISLFIIDKFLNSTNSEITMEMPKATLPVVSVELGQHKINTMYGYTSKRQEAYTKDNITAYSNRVTGVNVADFNSLNWSSWEWDIQ